MGQQRIKPHIFTVDTEALSRAMRKAGYTDKEIKKALKAERKQLSTHPKPSLNLLERLEQR